MRRGRGDKEDGEKHTNLLKLLQVLSFLVVFVAGVIIGLATTSHVNRYFKNQSQFFSTSTAAVISPPTVANADNCSTIVKSCDKVDCLSMKEFLNPSNLSHKMSDDELFWRASMVPYKQEIPFPRVPKVAFMFLTRGPLPFLPLWEKFFKGHENFNIYVHAVPGFLLNVSTDSPFYRREIPSQSVEWGTVQLFDAERRLLANALMDFTNERFILLSESCIPVHNFQTVYKYLTESTHSFIDSFDDPSRYGRGRFSRKMLPDIKLYQWRKGSQWFEMNRTLAIFVVSDTKYYNLFKKYCLPACYPDEHYIPTFINMFHGSYNANRTVTWVNWSFGGPHPAMYGRENITEGFIQGIRNNGTGTRCLYNGKPTSVCFLFARKFDPSALEPLLNLSSTVMEM